MKIIAVFLILVFTCGCSTVSGLKRLQALSISRDEQEAQLKEEEQKFKQLLEDFSSGKIERGISKDKIIETYGEPISASKINKDSSFLDELMYRLPTQFFGSEKVFLYFNNGDKLVDFRYEAQNKDLKK